MILLSLSEYLEQYRQVIIRFMCSTAHGTQLNVGYAYNTGEGIAKDREEAVKWFRRSAEQGNSGAQYSLGVAYYNGQGVHKDDAKAYYWYILASNGGPSNSAELRDEVAQKLDPTTRERIEEEASRWKPKAEVK